MTAEHFHKLGIGSESLSTARRIEFHQRSCNSATRQLRFSSFTVTRRLSVITLPICACGISFDFSSDKTRSVFFGSQEIMTRDCASLKSNVAASVEAGVSPAQPRFSKLISAPNNRSGLKQHSASATASPPSLQSRALLLNGEFGDRPNLFPEANLEKARPANVVAAAAGRGSAGRTGARDSGYRSNQDNGVPLILKPLRRDVFLVIDQTNHRYRRGGIDHPGRALIVKRDVASNYRRAEGATCLGNSLNCLAQLPEILRLVRITEVQIVRHRERSRAGTGEISRRFRDRNASALARIERAIQRVTIGRRRQDFVRLSNIEDRGTRARFYHCAGPNRVIVLAINPVLRRDRRITK